MTSRDFCFWLQGFFEINEASIGNMLQGLTSAQALMVRQHLNLVFKHEIDPSMGDAKHQKELNDIHHPFYTPPNSANTYAKSKAKQEAKKTLSELLPNHNVIMSNYPVDFANKPDDWEPGWEYDELYRAWHPPGERMRC